MTLGNVRFVAGRDINILKRDQWRRRRTGGAFIVSVGNAARQPFQQIRMATRVPEDRLHSRFLHKYAGSIKLSPQPGAHSAARQQRQIDFQQRRNPHPMLPLLALVRPGAALQRQRKVGDVTFQPAQQFHQPVSARGGLKDTVQQISIADDQHHTMLMVLAAKLRDQLDNSVDGPARRIDRLLLQSACQRAVDVAEQVGVQSRVAIIRQVAVDAHGVAQVAVCGRAQGGAGFGKRLAFDPGDGCKPRPPCLMQFVTRSPPRIVGSQLRINAVPPPHLDPFTLRQRAGG